MMLIEVIDKGSVPYCGSSQIKSDRKSLYCHTYTHDNRGNNNSDTKYVTNTNPEHEYEKNHMYGKGSMKPRLMSSRSNTHWNIQVYMKVYNCVKCYCAKGKTKQKQKLIKRMNKYILKMISIARHIRIHVTER